MPYLERSITEREKERGGGEEERGRMTCHFDRTCVWMILFTEKN